MKKTTDYIEEAKIKLDIQSDYGLAKWLGITDSAISHYKTGKRTIDDYTAARIAEALEIDPMEVIAAANAEREKDEKRREFWRKIFANCVAASFFLWISAPEIKHLGNGAINNALIMRNLIVSAL